MNKTTLIKTGPPIEWYIDGLINHPDFNIELLLKLYNELKNN